MTTPIRVFFQDNEILIDTIPAPFVAGSLVATFDGANINITRLQSSFLFTAVPWALLADINYNTFPTPDAAMAYLAGQLAMRRSLDIPTVAGVASMDLAQGMPLTVSRANQQLAMARADTYALSFVAGLAATAIGSGALGSATRNPVNLPDWTAIAGSQSLSVSQPYFLAPTGGITLQTPLAPVCACSVRLGQATGPQTFLFLQSDPILL